MKLLSSFQLATPASIAMVQASIFCIYCAMTWIRSTYTVNQDPVWKTGNINEISDGVSVLLGLLTERKTKQSKMYAS